MVEFFTFVFQSFWTFIGFLFIFSIAGGIITKLFKHFRLWGNINNFYINQPEESIKEPKGNKKQSDSSEITKVFTDLFNEFKNKGNK
tara:strand:- start:3777 stop:4037 length:261 start_codon:yes stop_codon:yes gene_type:complete